MNNDCGDSIVALWRPHKLTRWPPRLWVALAEGVVQHKPSWKTNIVSLGEVLPSPIQLDRHVE